MSDDAAGFSYDTSDRTVVVTCLDCGWRHLALRGTPDPLDGARRQAHAHERRAHPGQTFAVKALDDARRHATRRAATGNAGLIRMDRSNVRAWESSQRFA